MQSPGGDTGGYLGDNGPAVDARISSGSYFLSVDAAGNVFIADFGNHVIRKITVSDGKINTVAGSGTLGFSGDGGPALNAQLSGPWGVTVDTSGNIFIADTNNKRIRKVVSANPGPQVTGLSPSNGSVGGSGFTMTVNGSNFIASSVVRWNGQNRTTTFVSPTQLTATIPAADIASLGTAQVTVYSPAPGGGSSSAATFSINNPAPALTSLSPSAVTAGGPGLTLTVNGSNFISGSVVRWNGQDRATSYVSGTQLTASLLSGDIAAAGTSAVTVFNPTPGGGTSSGLNFTIGAAPNPLPALSSLSPSSVQAGAAAFTLTANGSNFVNGTSLRWNGVSLTTTFVSNAQLTASVPASNVGVPGTIDVTASSPAPGGGVSNAVAFTVTPVSNPAPLVTSLSPDNAAAGGQTFTLIVNGSNFASGAVVRWNSLDRTTTFVSSTQLTASIPSTDIAAGDIVLVTVFNPAPGGGNSNALAFNVNALRSPASPTGLIVEKWSDATLPIEWRPATHVGSTQLAILRSAFAAWDNVTTAQITFSEGAATTETNAAFDQINTVSLAPTSIGAGVASLTVLYSFGSPGVDQFGRIIAFPGQILEADVLFNTAVSYSTEATVPADKIDLQSQATHEVGHLLGLDHSGLVSDVMAPILPAGANRRTLSAGDVIRISNLYPASGFFNTRGSFAGRVRLADGTPVFGAHVVITDSSGRPVVSTITDSDGIFQVHGLEGGDYTAYAEPLDAPLTPAGVPSLSRMYPGTSPLTNFSSRFAVTGAASTANLTKTAGDNQKANVGKVLPLPLEVQLKDLSGNPITGAPIFFAATGGGGSLAPIRVITDAEGKARVRAYMGTGATATFRASYGASTVSFAATLP